VGDASIYFIPGGGGMAGGYGADGCNHRVINCSCVEEEDVDELLDPLSLFGCERSSRKRGYVLGLCAEYWCCVRMGRVLRCMGS